MKNNSIHLSTKLIVLLLTALIFLSSCESFIGEDPEINLHDDSPSQEACEEMLLTRSSNDDKNRVIPYELIAKLDPKEPKALDHLKALLSKNYGAQVKYNLEICMCNLIKINFESPLVGLVEKTLASRNDIEQSGNPFRGVQNIELNVRIQFSDPFIDWAQL